STLWRLPHRDNCPGSLYLNTLPASIASIFLLSAISHAPHLKKGKWVEK
ncbi:MAG: hypothetical protein ACI956_002491, partial [Nonlabens sp.]